MSKRIIDSKRISTNSLEMPDEYKLSISSSWSHVTVNESLPARLKGMRKASFFKGFHWVSQCTAEVHVPGPGV